MLESDKDSRKHTFNDCDSSRHPCIKSKDIIDKANFVKTKLYIVKSSSQLKG